MSIVVSNLPISRTGLDLGTSTESGAVVDFLGVVRALESERVIAGIDYEAYVEMAEHQLRQLRIATIREFELEELECTHRIGFVPAGEASLYIRVKAAHRDRAFRAMMRFIDELKRIVPIWKHPRWIEE